MVSRRSLLGLPVGSPQQYKRHTRENLKCQCVASLASPGERSCGNRAGDGQEASRIGKNLLTSDSHGKMIPISLRIDFSHAQACGPRAVLRLIRVMSAQGFRRTAG